MTDLPESLALARSWLETAGDSVELTSIEGPENDLAPALVVTHGSVKLRVVLQGDQLAVTAGFGIPANARAKLKTLPEDVKKKLFLAFRQELLSCHRVGFLYQPLDAQNVAAIESFVVLEVLVVGAGDLSTRNRLLDAVQEVATTGIRGMQVFGVASAGGSAPQPTAPPPPGIYG